MGIWVCLILLRLKFYLGLSLILFGLIEGIEIMFMNLGFLFFVITFNLFGMNFMYCNEEYLDLKGQIPASRPKLKNQTKLKNFRFDSD